MLRSYKWKLAQRLEFLWWKKYLQNKNFFEYLEWKKSYWIKFLHTIQLSELILVKDSIIIADLGSGPAGIFTVLPENTCVAVDPLMNSYLTKGWIAQENYPKTEFIHERLEELELSVKPNIIFCLNCINHVRDIEACLTKLYDLCNSDGVVVVSTDVHTKKFFKYLFQIIPIADPLHPYQLNDLDYVHLFSLHGFTVESNVLLEKHSIFDYRVYVLRKS